VARGPDEISVVIGDNEWRFWSKLTVNLALDAYSTVSLTSPFDPTSAEHRETFRPFTFKPMQVLVGGKPLFTGTMVDVFPTVGEESRTVEVGGYALPGVLADCSAPGSTVPHEWKGVGLRAIAAALLAPFSLELGAFDEGVVFDKVKLEPGNAIQGFLVELAKQRGLVVNNTSLGAVRFWQSIIQGNPVARLEEGERPLTRITPAFSPQQFFSELTGFTAAKKGVKGDKYRAPNPWLASVVRPFSFQLEDTPPGGGPAATRAKLGRMFADMAAFTVDNLPTWRDPQGELWTPNTLVNLLAPGAMVYTESELLIRGVTLDATSEARTAALGLVLPGSFSGAAPTVLPWSD